MTVDVLEQAAQEVEADNRSSYDDDDSALDSTEDMPSEEVETEEDTEEKPASFKGTKHKVKVDKEESEVEYDELVRGYEHAKAAAKRMQEAAEIRKTADNEIKEVRSENEQLRNSVSTLTSFLTELRGNPDLVIQLGNELGVDFEEWAHRTVLKKIQYQNMSEAERRAHDLEQEKAKLAKDLERYKSQEETAKKSQELKAAQTKVASEMVSYFEEKGITQPDSDVMERAIELMKLTKANPDGRWAFAKAYEHAQKELSSKINSIAGNSFLDRAKRGELSEEEIKAFREFETKNMRKRQVPQTQSAPRKPVNKYRTIDEAFKDL